MIYLTLTLTLTLTLASSGLSADDLPSLVLFLMSVAECEEIVAQATIASVFSCDEFDQEEFDLPAAGQYWGLSDQYLFNADSRH